MAGVLSVQGCEVLAESFKVYTTLLKIMVPVLILVKVLEELGLVVFIGNTLQPLMGLLGLPEAMSVVWAATLFTNIYTGVLVFLSIAAEQPMTVAQVTVLGAILLMSHSIPVEGAVARRAGVPWWLTVLLRVGGAFVLGGILNLLYSKSGYLQESNVLMWNPPPVEASLSSWAINQFFALVSVFFIILFLIVFLRIIRALGIERVLTVAVVPVLRVIGVSRKAANIIIIGLTLGLSFGAGLLIRDIESGSMEMRDAFLAVCFLGVCHSLIDDTILVMLLGAHLSGVLWARVIFALLLMAVVSRVWAGKYQ
ncbi:hypothetical protein AB833_10470 [Chromatiales bacterium (ex Bugula neritina AB1)]|nr:hypothetical protein AB833_10470 [Chromatiales bacterium (ex Bugula neritina AB1)]